MRRAVVVVVVVAMAGACGSHPGARGSSSRGSTSSIPSTAPAADADLVGTTWSAIRYFHDDREVLVEPPGSPGSVRLEPNGFVTGSDGCNGFGYSLGAAPDGSGGDLGRRYVVEGSTITFSGAAISTLVGCPDQEHRQALQAVLTGSVRYRIRQRTLVLTATDGWSVHFRAPAG